MLLLDSRGRRYLITLDAVSTFHTHWGMLPHASIIGAEEGSRLRTSLGRDFLVLRPTLAEYILETPRISQIIYPKDLGTILLEADIFPGATVLEAGIGSGALTMTLLRAVGERGHVISYEIREDLLRGALKNITPMFPERPNHTVKLCDLYQGIEEEGLDRVLLDVAEPWQAVGHAAQALAPGGILLCFLPTVLQIHQLVEAIQAEPRFDLAHTLEVWQRPWHVTRQSVRPEHRMVAHTGFIITARRCAPRKRVAPPAAEGESVTDPEQEERELPGG